MANSRYLMAALLTFLTLVLASCSSGKSEAVTAIETYIQALGDKDVDQISTVSCAEWEPNALLEIDSFTAVDSKIENLACEETSQDGQDVLVNCTGVIALDYDGEAQEIDLSNRTYVARQVGGEWLMCGYH